MYINYQGLNKVTKLNCYLLFLIIGLLEQLIRASFFTKIDLKGAFNLVLIKEMDEWKNTFMYKVLPCRTQCYGIWSYQSTPNFQAHDDDVFWK